MSLIFILLQEIKCIPQFKKKSCRVLLKSCEGFLSKINKNEFILTTLAHTQTNHFGGHIREVGSFDTF